MLAAKAPATVFRASRSARGRIVNIEKKTEHACHYSFHIMDPDWGHVTIKMSGDPPFPAQVILNGHAAPRGASLYPRLSRDGLGGRFVGLMARVRRKVVLAGQHC